MRNKTSSGHSYLSEHSEIFCTGADKYQMHVANELYLAMIGEESSICNEAGALETQNIIDRILKMAHNEI